ncbi:MAG: hypothetical protein ACT4OO_11750 [Nitrospiraceae bacterium]
MNISEILLWGLLATGLLTTIMRASQALHLTRIDVPFLLGTMLSPNRDRAKIIGFVIHFLNGWWMAFLYAAFFHTLGFSAWWLGGVMGLAHAAFVLIVVLPLLPGLHPHMASEFQGPELTRLLEPPGFLALNYGYQTPVVTVVAHIAYGMILGGFYKI